MSEKCTNFLLLLDIKIRSVFCRAEAILYSAKRISNFFNDGEEIIHAKVEKRAWLAKNFESELGHS